MFCAVLCTLPLAQPSEDNGERKERRLSVLMLSLPFAGLFSPLVALGEELVRRRHNVTICTAVDKHEQWPDRLKKRAERAGVNFVSTSGSAGELVSFIHMRFPKEFGLSIIKDVIKVTTEISQEIAETVDSSAIKDWDVIVANDFLFPLLACLHWKWKIPSISLSSALQFQPHTRPQWPFPIFFGTARSDNLSFSDRLMFGLMSSLTATLYDQVLVRGIRSRLEDTCAGISLTYMSTAPGVYLPQIVATVIGFEFPRTISPLTEYIGPILSRSPEPLDNDLKTWLDGKGNRNVIYISMGSLVPVSNETGRAIALGISGTKYSAIWSLRKNNQDVILQDLKLDPERFFISSWTPQLRILQHKAISMTIMHGGLNGVSEALYNGVPIVVLPFGGEPGTNADRVHSQGLGISLDLQTVTEEKIRESIEQIDSGDYHEKAKNVRKMFLHAGGLKRAADLVEFYEEVGYDHLVPAYAKYEWNWIQYYNVDVYTLMLCIVLLCMYSTCRLCSCVCRRCVDSKEKKD